VTGALHELAPAKVNLCLYLGPARESDGRHELVTVFQPVGLADRVSLAPAGFGERCDAVICPGLPGAPADNLAAIALRVFRDRAGWDGPPVRVHIDKRIPVAAGMAGGSADAGATLRLAARAAGVDDDELLYAIAAELGADVPAQVRPARYLATGIGERLVAAGEPADFGILVLPARAALATGDVFRQAERMGLARSPAALRDKLHAVQATASDLSGELVVNDLEPAARALCPAIDLALDDARRAGAHHALVCGSGPTVVGLFDSRESARAGATMLADREPRAIATAPWRAVSGRAAA